MIRKNNCFVRATRHFPQLEDATKEANRIVDALIEGTPLEDITRKRTFEGLRDWLSLE